MKYDCIEYRGKCRSYMIEILPSRKVVKLWKGHPYWFTKEDSQDDEAIRYYKSMEGSGIVLCVVDADKVEDTSRESFTPQETTEVVENEIPTPEVETTSDVESAPEVESTPEEAPVESEEVNPELVEATHEELVEFLDLTYDEEEIKSVARDTGVKRIRDSWDKATLIEKIIENNPQYVVNLMKK